MLQTGRAIKEKEVIICDICKKNKIRDDGVRYEEKELRKSVKMGRHTVEVVCIVRKPRRKKQSQRPYRVYHNRLAICLACTKKAVDLAFKKVKAGEK